jgi:hypothetical protein
MDTQICTKCNTSKQVTDFYYSPRNKLGYSTICIECSQKSYEINRMEWEKQRVEAKAEEKRIMDLEIKAKAESLKIIQEKELIKKQKRREEQLARNLSRYQGYIYLLICANGMYKIGRSRNIEERIRGLNREIPIHIHCVHHFLSDCSPAAEKYMHNKFSNERVGYEWFNLSPEQVEWICSLKDRDIDNILANELNFVR